MKQHPTCLAAILLFGFVLGTFKGYVALWKDGRSEPFQIFPCPVDSLSEPDREALEQGIYARSEIELNQLLEDYLS